MKIATGWIHRIVGVAGVLVVAGCANPLNRHTYFEYRTKGEAAENAKEVSAALEYYARAEVNVRIGNLGPELESDAKFNLGRIKRICGQLEDSEILLRQAVALDRRLISERRMSPLQLGYTISELATTLLLREKFDEGVTLMAELEPIGGDMEPRARGFVTRTFERYSEAASKRGDAVKAVHFREAARKLAQ
jgi:tetratricopeptide (TPR) repeat protein